LKKLLDLVLAASAELAVSIIESRFAICGRTEKFGERCLPDKATGRDDAHSNPSRCDDKVSDICDCVRGEEIDARRSAMLLRDKWKRAIVHDHESARETKRGDDYIRFLIGRLH